jgi:hypothetical protein
MKRISTIRREREIEKKKGICTCPNDKREKKRTAYLSKFYHLELSPIKSVSILER